MSTLESLVPSLELCNKIPAGKFDDSALVWEEYINFEGKQGYYVDAREWSESDIPAPTLAEIMAELPKSLQISWIEWNEYPGEWQIYCRLPGEKSSPLGHDDNPASAALKLWLELKAKNTEESKK